MLCIEHCLEFVVHVQKLNDNQRLEAKTLSSERVFAAAETDLDKEDLPSHNRTIAQL